MVLERVFTAQPTKINWIKTTSSIKDSNGKTVFELPEVEAPDFWSENAINIVASKYFKKINGENETSVKQLIHRVVGQITGWGFEQKYFDGESALIFQDELTHLLTNQMACFNSPIWFNFGVPGREQQAAACFLLGLEDNSESIRNWTTTESKIFKGGSGSGVNISNLRPKNAALSTGGYASGPLSFTLGADYNAGVWKSGGATRRAATLRRMDVNHSDIEEFITCKSKEEKKAYILMDAGYSAEEATATVAYQNMNHSVGVTDYFMHRVVQGDKKANQIIRLMAQCAWESGDPGIQYHDTINKWNTIPNSGPITTSNPCGEYLSTDWSSCLLASFNLIKFIRYGAFDYDKFKVAVDIITLALDIIIDKADYPDERFKDTAHRQRQLGIGYSNLGALLMSMGIAYDSNEGRDLAARITSTMTAESYLQSAKIANELGAFEDFKNNEEGMRSVINMHYKQAAVKWGTSDDCTELWAEVFQTGVYNIGYRGYRNATTTLIAPTGTISFMMDCDTTGLEPEFSLIKHKKLVGGGTLTLVNTRIEEALKALNYESAEDIDEIWKYVQKHGTVVGCPAISDSHVPVFACAVGTKNIISYQGHLEMVAAIQPFVSMGISKTINMPNDATIEDIYKLYIDGWKKDIKSISIYRDGSKHHQPLNTGHSKARKEEPQQETVRKSLPSERPSLTHKIEIAGFEGYITVGLYEDGRPGEVFIHASKLGSTVSGLLDSLAISISFALQHGVPLHLLADKFKNTRFEPAGFTKNSKIPLTTSIVDYIFRWLEQKFILDEKHDIMPYVYSPMIVEAPKKESQNDGVLCKKCGEIMQRTGTCFTCHECGDNSGGCM